MTMSGLNCHSELLANCRAGGMSAGFPRGAPLSAHFTIVAISASVNEGSFLNFWIPIVRSMWNGGISRAATLVFIVFAHGRASSYVMSDIGAISPGRWQVTHERCRIGATSFVNVTVCACAVAVVNARAGIAPKNAQILKLNEPDCILNLTFFMPPRSGG